MRAPGLARQRWLSRDAIDGALFAAATVLLLTSVFDFARVEQLPLAMLLGAAVGQSRWRSYLRAVFTVLLVVWFVLGQTPLVDSLAERAVRSDSLPPSPVDAAVVLSSWISPRGTLDAAATERLLTGLAVVKRARVPFLVTTRTERASGGGRRTSDADQGALLALADVHVPWSIVGPVGSTRDEAVRTAALLLPRSARRLVVVTSWTHTRRACATFEHLGFTVTCIAARERSKNVSAPISSNDRIELVRQLLYEQAAMTKYRWRGWI